MLVLRPSYKHIMCNKYFLHIMIDATFNTIDPRCRPVLAMLYKMLPIRFSLLLIIICYSSIAIATPPKIIMQTGGVIKENSDGAIVDIDLSDRPLNDHLIEALASLPELSVLRLRRTSISDEQLGQLASLSYE